MQAALLELGYLDGPLSGDYDEETTTALARFQDDQGLPADGEVTAQTVAELTEAQEASRPDETPPEPTTDVPDGRDTGGILAADQAPPPAQPSVPAAAWLAGGAVALAGGAALHTLRRSRG
ncbi:MAG: peptidoglycan-binding domain-containing protein [Nitriliruptoraceae bacterium]